MLHLNSMFFVHYLVLSLWRAHILLLKASDRGGPHTSAGLTACSEATSLVLVCLYGIKDTQVTEKVS